MHQCPRCHYESFKKNDLKCHFNRKKHCLPIYDDMSLEKLREKIVVKNAFKMKETNTPNNTPNNTHNPQLTSNTSFNNKTENN